MSRAINEFPSRSAPARFLPVRSAIPRKARGEDEKLFLECHDAGGPGRHDRCNCHGANQRSQPRPHPPQLIKRRTLILLSSAKSDSSTAHPAATTQKTDLQPTVAEQLDALKNITIFSRAALSCSRPRSSTSASRHSATLRIQPRLSKARKISLRATARPAAPMSNDGASCSSPAGRSRTSAARDRRASHDGGRAVSRAIGPGPTTTAIRSIAPWRRNISRLSFAPTPTTPSITTTPKTIRWAARRRPSVPTSGRLNRSQSAATSASTTCADAFSACAAACGLSPRRATIPAWCAAHGISPARTNTLPRVGADITGTCSTASTWMPGIFVSYIGLFSYYNFDNWTYQPSFVSSNTPWFFNGVRLQWFPTSKLKIEPWFINGWQTYARPNGKPGLGGQVLWRPMNWFELVSNNYGLGEDDPLEQQSQLTGGTGATRSRIHTDNSIELKYYDKPKQFLDKMAFTLTGDLGCEYGGGAAGGYLSRPTAVSRRWALTDTYSGGVNCHNQRQRQAQAVLRGLDGLSALLVQEGRLCHDPRRRPDDQSRPLPHAAAAHQQGDGRDRFAVLHRESGRPGSDARWHHHAGLHAQPVHYVSPGDRLSFLRHSVLDRPWRHYAPWRLEQRSRAICLCGRRTLGIWLRQSERRNRSTASTP